MVPSLDVVLPVCSHSGPHSNLRAVGRRISRKPVLVSVGDNAPIPKSIEGDAGCLIMIREHIIIDKLLLLGEF